ncbi:MAG TPA: right-handed parallel beta-helix repeat-containing protein, partial [Verrucomicrobiae bacterium]|nr:right-handed parallel beta-helix repeat-containing protein [Verrucomicrobiae bacterium]
MTRRALGIAIAVLFGSGLSPAAVIKVNSSTMLVEGVLSNTHVVTPNPHFSWTVPSGTQTNWQIQIDSDPNFNGHFGQIWFWDSGSGSKSGQEGSTNVQYASISAPGFFPRSIDTRADLIYWRLRVQINNDPNWNTDPNYFSTGVFKLNLLPISPDSVSAADEPIPGVIPATLFPALNPLPKEFFVSPTGDDASAGTLAAPFKTISKGVTVLNPGDTLSIRAGVYNENVRLTPTPTGVKNGTAGNPITIRARPGEAVTVRGVTVGTQPFAPFQFVGASTSIQHWVLAGVKLGGTGAAVGVYFNFADFITLRNLSFESTFNASGTGVQILGGGFGNRILNSVFDTRMFDMIENGGSKYLEVRGNEFKNQNGHVAIHWHNSGSQGGIIEGNSFHDLVTTEGGVFAYLSCDGLVVRDNLFYNISEAPNGYAAGIVPLRCGKVLIENNTFVNNRRGIGINEFARFLIIRNNIFFKNTGPALDFTPLQSAQQGSSTVGTVVTHNFSFNNVKDTDFFYPQDANTVTFVSNCFGGPNPSSNLACDPKFVNAAANDFHLAAG